MTDTIFALSTPPGKSGIAVVRTSGPESFPVAEALAGKTVPVRTPALRSLREPIGGELIDHALLLAFEGPASFSGEDIVEYHVHGGPAILAALFEAFATFDNLRPADPGEFSRRAFENGKLDLTQIEGLADLIDAETTEQRRQALRSYDGALFSRIEDWRAQILQALALAEARFDFADEGEITDSLDQDVIDRIHTLHAEIKSVLDDNRLGERIRNGMRIVIAGPPNVGKSTLLNALVQRDAAITSPIPGTTRDVIEVGLDIGGFAIRLVDTAGLHATADPVEQEGLRRAQREILDADLILWVSDTQEGLTPPGFDTRAPVWPILGKADIQQRVGRQGEAGRPQATLSAKTGEGLGALTDSLMAFAGANQKELPIITRARHRQCISEMAGYLATFLGSDTAPDDVRTESLRLAADCLGRLTGRIDVENVLDTIFSSFCIGK